MTVFAMLWGFPFLVRGQGLSEQTRQHAADGDDGLGGGQRAVLGWLVAPIPYYRSWIVIGVVGEMAVPWTAVLLRDTPAPMWLLVVLVCTTAAGGPASMVGFDLARSFTPPEALRPRQRAGQRRRVLGLPDDHGADRHRARPAPAGGMDGLRPRRLPGRDLGAVPVLGLGIIQILRYRRRGLAHLRRVHPGASSRCDAASPSCTPASSDREGV